MGGLQAKGKCQGADLHVGKMPAKPWYLVAGGWELKGLPPQQRGNVLIRPTYVGLKALLSFATFSHATGYWEVLLVV